MGKKQFFAKKRLTKTIESIKIVTVKTSSVVSVFSESLPLAVRRVNGEDDETALRFLIIFKSTV